MKYIVLCAAILCAAMFSRSDEIETASDSLYRMTATLTTQQNHSAGLDLYRGHPVVISMFYGSCAAACPMLITAIQTYESHLNNSEREQLRVLMISFDAARDTPKHLLEVATTHSTDAARWTFSSASEQDARKIAALLGIKYRHMPDGEFEHSLLITLLDNDGRVLVTTTKLYDDETFLAALRTASGVHH